MGGLHLSTSRFEFLSGAAIPALAILVIGAISRFGLWDLLIAFSNLVVVLVSVTRTEIAVLAGQALSIIIGSPSLVFRPSIMKKVVLALLLVSSVFVLDLAANTGLTSRWTVRLFASKSAGSDVTALTRSAETHFMIGAMTSSVRSFLVGNGLAARTSLTGADAVKAANIVGDDCVSFHSIGFGHNNHVSLLFIGGLMFGGPLLLITFLNGFSALRLIRRILTTEPLDQPESNIALWGALIVIGMLAYGCLAGTLSDRTTSLWYGIGTGMLFWSRQFFRKKGEEENAPLYKKEKP
jgi:hypothetical protein